MQFEITNKKGQTFAVTVDDADSYLISQMHLRCSFKGDKWYVQGHRRGEPSNKPFYLHRIIAAAQKGDVVDHINGDTLDNRKSNLRVCNQASNLMNRRGRKVGTSKYKGVSWSVREKRWRVSLTKDGKCLFTKYCIDERQAAQEYNKAAKKFFGKFAFVNEVK